MPPIFPGYLTKMFIDKVNRGIEPLLPANPSKTDYRMDRRVYVPVVDGGFRKFILYSILSVFPPQSSGYTTR
jgi:hypothetical protein